MRKEQTDKFIGEVRRRQRSRARIKQKVATPILTDTPCCAVIGCGRPARQATNSGVGSYCGPHLLQVRRHGSAYRKSFTRGELAPYRFAAIKWIERNATNPFVTGALEEAAHVLRYSGRALRADEVRWNNAETKARAVWARCRERKVDPRVIVALELGVAAAIAAGLNMPTGPAGVDFKRVQSGKVLMRLGGGVRPKAIEGQEPQASYAYSSGRVLRILGAKLETIGELLVSHHSQDVLDTKRALEAEGRKVMAKHLRPFPARYRKRDMPQDDGEAQRQDAETTTTRPAPRWTRTVQVQTDKGEVSRLKIETN